MILSRLEFSGISGSILPDNATLPVGLVVAPLSIVGFTMPYLHTISFPFSCFELPSVFPIALREASKTFFLAVDKASVVELAIGPCMGTSPMFLAHPALSVKGSTIGPRKYNPSVQMTTPPLTIDTSSIWPIMSTYENATLSGMSFLGTWQFFPSSSDKSVVPLTSPIPAMVVPLSNIDLPVRPPILQIALAYKRDNVSTCKRDTANFMNVEINPSPTTTKTYRSHSPSISSINLSLVNLSI